MKVSLLISYISNICVGRRASQTRSIGTSDKVAYHFVDKDKHSWRWGEDSCRADSLIKFANFYYRKNVSGFNV